MEFIPATMDDAALLIKWRNDSMTKSMSIATEEIDWLKGTSKNQSIFGLIT